MEDREVRENIIEGRNPVLEALKKKRTIEQILITKGDKEGVIRVIIAQAKENKIPVKEVDKRKLDAMSQTKAHQGVIAITSDFKYCEVQDILDYARERGEAPLL
ncbi:MAG: 23S rRNA (guanosine(2251)-2'-O)-methyltransferase RlmB, partial [Bacillota bacterium]|nr:23S rRNA (guanosine(2251)-2'-O)-methyltransferase RlmB [Bacillota bacterium]